MKSKRYILAVVAIIIAFLVGLYVGERDVESRAEVSIETVVDTVTYCVPAPQSTTTLGTQRYMLPKYVFVGEMVRQSEPDSIKECIAEEEKGCGEDSAIVELPMMQRHYADSTYEAWVSGPIAPKLDSVRVYVPTTIITRREVESPNRWHLGVTAGYGYGAKGFQPYVGVGITYSIISF